MTSRTADYFIFGQSALLAGSVTTVFCNAVEKKSKACGGSCFIGVDSWTDDDSHVLDRNTPYAGWSKGIYYNQNLESPLGKKEQAVVIADVDPQYMLALKPRPQALAIPMQLVAYLPIVEWDKLDENENQFFSTVDQALTQLNSSAGKIAQPNLSSVDFLSEAISSALANTDDGSFSKRFDYWKKHWRINPVAGVPPAIVDWLWIDKPQTPEKIFVPPCGSDGFDVLSNDANQDLTGTSYDDESSNKSDDS